MAFVEVAALGVLRPVWVVVGVAAWAGAPAGWGVRAARTAWAAAWAEVVEAAAVEDVPAAVVAVEAAAGVVAVAAGVKTGLVAGRTDGAGVPSPESPVDGHGDGPVGHRRGRAGR